MKNKLKSIVLGTIIAVTAFAAGGCMNDTITASTSNRMYWELGTNYFDKAVIDVHKEVIEVDVKKWTDYEDSDAIVIVTTDGTVYYTHLRDCTLIGKE
ncbi:MAG: hypothetical protein K2M91_01855 [Lachnospiraceae bacterium]|nr:hypothetical protein [Lachnospiraceae bacterium]